MNKERLINNFAPALIWFGYHAVVPNWQFNFLSALMLIRALIVFYCFLVREVPQRRAPAYQICIAWASTFLPTLMVWYPSNSLMSLIGQVVAVFGMVLFCFACVELGKSFGVSPALRSPVSSGVYGWLPHPMYASHVIVEAGILLASPSAINLVISAVAWGLYFVRARLERKMLWLSNTQVVAASLSVVK